MPLRRQRSRGPGRAAAPRPAGIIGPRRLRVRILLALVLLVLVPLDVMASVIDHQVWSHATSEAQRDAALQAETLATAIRTVVDRHARNLRDFASIGHPSSDALGLVRDTQDYLAASSTADLVVVADAATGEVLAASQRTDSGVADAGLAGRRLAELPVYAGVPRPDTGTVTVAEAREGGDARPVGRGGAVLPLLARSSGVADGRPLLWGVVESVERLFAPVVGSQAASLQRSFGGAVDVVMYSDEDRVIATSGAALRDVRSSVRDGETLVGGSAVFVDDAEGISLDWQVIVGIDSDLVLGGARSLRLRMSIVVGVTGLLVIAAANWLSRRFSGRLNEQVQSLQSFSTTLQDLSAELDRDTSEATASASDAGTASDEVAHRVDDLAGAFEQMATTVRGVAVSADSATGVAEAALVRVDTARSRIDRLAEAAQEAAGLVSSIERIAAHTNLLALNASIEASRAGEAGRGFGVVADEVKGLAVDTARTTQVATRQLTAMRDDAMALIDEVGELTTVIAQMSGIHHEITQAVEAQYQANHDIGVGMSAAAKGAQSVTASARQAVVTAEGARSVAERLTQAAGLMDEAAIRLSDFIGLDPDADDLGSASPVGAGSGWVVTS